MKRWILGMVAGAMGLVSAPGQPGSQMPATTYVVTNLLRATSQSNLWARIGIVSSNQTEVTNWITDASAINTGTLPLARLSGIKSNNLDSGTWNLATQRVAVAAGANVTVTTNAGQTLYSVAFTGGGATNGIQMLGGYGTNTTFHGNTIFQFTNDAGSANTFIKFQGDGANHGQAWFGSLTNAMADMFIFADDIWLLGKDERTTNSDYIGYKINGLPGSGHPFMVNHTNTADSDITFFNVYRQLYPSEIVLDAGGKIYGDGSELTNITSASFSGTLPLAQVDFSGVFSGGEVAYADAQGSNLLASTMSGSQLALLHSAFWGDGWNFRWTNAFFNDVTITNNLTVGGTLSYTYWTGVSNYVDSVGTIVATNFGNGSEIGVTTNFDSYFAGTNGAYRTNSGGDIWISGDLHASGSSLYLGPVGGANSLKLSVQDGLPLLEVAGATNSGVGLLQFPNYWTNDQFFLSEVVVSENVKVIGGGYGFIGNGEGLTNIYSTNLVGAIAEATNATYATYGTNDDLGNKISTSYPLLTAASNYFSGDLGIGGTVSIFGGDGTTTFNSNVVVQGWLQVDGAQTNTGAIYANGGVVGDVTGALTGNADTATLATVATGATNDDAGAKISTTYLKANQTITLSGDATGSGTTAITVTTTNVSWQTNVNTTAPDFSKPYSTVTTNDAFTFLAPLNVSATLVQSAVILVTNSTATAKAVTAPANVHTQGTWYVTNVTTFTFFNYPGVCTNAIAFPLW